MSDLQDVENTLAQYRAALEVSHNRRDPRCTEQPSGLWGRWRKRRARRHECFICRPHGDRPTNWPDSARLDLDQTQMRDLYAEIRMRLGGTTWGQGAEEFEAWMLRVQERSLRKAIGPIPTHAELELGHVLNAFVLYGAYTIGGGSQRYADEFNRIIRSRDRRLTLRLADAVRGALEDDPTRDPVEYLETFADGDLIDHSN